MDEADRAPPLQVGTGLQVMVALLFAASIVLATAEVVSAVGSDPRRPEIVDFHPFYLAGRLVWDGHFADGYRVPVMQALQRSFGGGRDVLMPFVYPPLFGLVMAPFALLPVGPAFLLFVASTLALYVAVLRRLAGAWFWTALLAASPILLIDIRMGQNGLLTGGLAGLSVALALGRRQGLGGLAAGALAFKPQMATMLPILFGLRRERRALVVAGVTALGLSGVAVMVLGRDTVPGFLASTSVAADFMAAGSFALYRMTSVYACALSLGAPARVALALHSIVALAVVTITARVAGGLSGLWSASRRAGDDGAGEPRIAAGLTLMATAFVSPYFFDYDLTVFDAGLALVLPGLARVMTQRRLTILLVGIGTVEAAGLLFTALASVRPGTFPSLGGPALLVCYGIMLATLWGGPVETTQRQPIPVA